MLTGLSNMRLGKLRTLWLDGCAVTIECVLSLSAERCNKLTCLSVRSLTAVSDNEEEPVLAEAVIDPDWLHTLPDWLHRLLRLIGWWSDQSYKPYSSSHTLQGICAMTLPQNKRYLSMSRAELNKRSCQLRSIVEHLDSIFSAMKPKQSINDDSSHAYTDTHIIYIFCVSIRWLVFYWKKYCLFYFN